MAGSTARTLDARTAVRWRAWLRDHHKSDHEIWLVFYKKHTGVSCLSYDEAVNEALCYGWVDSIKKRLDDRRFVYKFTPRKAESKWSASNRIRYAALKRAGRLAAAGRDRAPTARSGDAPRPRGVPAYIKKALAKNAAARKNFEALAPSHKRAYLGWIDSAQKAETKERRLMETVALLALGKKLGLK